MAHHLSKLKFSLMLRAVGIWKHLTLGARVAVIVGGKILVVKHTYTDGWQLPGGGVDPGETAEQAGRREVLEETGYAVDGAMTLFGIYHSVLYTNRDHVTLYLADAVRMERPFVPGREIAEIAWLSLDALPDDLSPATRRRLDEIVGKASPPAQW